MADVQTVAKQLVETIGSVAGIRFGLEEPRFDAVELARGAQVRQYGERIAAQTRCPRLPRSKPGPPGSAGSPSTSSAPTTAVGASR